MAEIPHRPPYLAWPGCPGLPWLEHSQTAIVRNHFGSVEVKGKAWGCMGIGAQFITEVRATAERLRSADVGALADHRLSRIASALTRRIRRL